MKERKEKESGRTLDVGTWVCPDTLRKKLDIWKNISSGFLFFLLRPGLIFKDRFHNEIGKYTEQ